MIYSVNCAIKHLNNRGQKYNVNVMDKRTRKAAYEDATARRYWSIHELIVVLLARAMYS